MAHFCLDNIVNRYLYNKMSQVDNRLRKKREPHHKTNKRIAINDGH